MLALRRPLLRGPSLLRLSPPRPTAPPSLPIPALVRTYAKKKHPKPALPESRTSDHPTPTPTIPSPSQAAPPAFPDPSAGLAPAVLRTIRDSRNISDHVKSAMRHMVHPVVIVTTATSSDPADWRGITLSSFNTVSLDPLPLVSFNIRNPSACAKAMLERGEFVVHTMLPTPRAADFAARFSQPYIRGQDWRYSIRKAYNIAPEASSTTSTASGTTMTGSTVITQEEQDALLADTEDGPLSAEDLALLSITPPQSPSSLTLRTGQFARIPFSLDHTTSTSPSSPPLPVLTEEVMFRLHCRIHITAPIQDHTLYIAQVLSLTYPPTGSWPNPHGSFGIEESAPLSLLYGDQTFREAGLRLIERNNKFRRWFRRKIEFEENARMVKMNKLHNRLERVRTRLRRETLEREGMQAYSHLRGMPVAALKQDPPLPLEEKVKSDPAFVRAMKGVTKERAKELENWKVKVLKKKLKSAQEKKWQAGGGSKGGSQPWIGRGRGGGR
ncbi:flavin reductase like domain-containing protein [Peziza echinospora]|nr:flavin reductase like domain-containing protein [Peziza echinospora]